MISAIVFASILSASDPAVSAVLENGKRLSDDKFAEIMDVPALSDETILVPFTDGTVRGPQPDTSAFYTYEDGILTLYFSPHTASNLGKIDIREPVTYRSEVVVFSVLTPAGVFVGTNSFGASTDVQRFEKETVSVSFGERSDFTAPRGEVALEIPPSQARELAGSARLSITFASLDALAGTSDCTYTRQSATISRPNEVDELKCVVDAPVDRIAVIDSLTGEELGEVYRAR